MSLSPRLQILLSILLLTATVLGTFAGSCKNDFVNWDDQNEILENPHFNPVTLVGLGWNWTHTQLSLYMPVTYMVWGATAAIAPRDAAGFLKAPAFHALNLGLHLLCTLLVFGVILQLWKIPLPALVGAMVFAVHPMQVEAVAWASGMYTLLSSALSLAALLAYIAHVQRRLALPAVRSVGFFWLATLLYLLALLTKAASVSLPLFAIVIDVLLLKRPLRRAFWSMAFWIVLAIPIVQLAKSFQDVSVITVPPVWLRPAVALDAIGFYLVKIMCPLHLIPDYGRNPAWVMQHGSTTLLAIAFAIVAITAALFSLRKNAWVAAGMGILLAGIGPYLGLTAFDFQYVSTVADRYVYFGMMGVALIAAGAILQPGTRRNAALLLLSVAFCIWIPLSMRQVHYWRDTSSLFNHTLEVNSNSLVAHNVFGFLAARRGDFPAAENEYLAGIRVWPEDALIHFNLGNLYLKQRQISPVERQRMLEQAIEHYSRAVQYQPQMTDYRNSYAAALELSGQHDQAYAEWMRVLAQDAGGYIDARNNLADMLANNGKPAEARVQYNIVLKISPGNPHAMEHLRMLVER